MCKFEGDGWYKLDNTAQPPMLLTTEEEWKKFGGRKLGKDTFGFTLFNGHCFSSEYIKDPVYGSLIVKDLHTNVKEWLQTHNISYWFYKCGSFIKDVPLEDVASIYFEKEEDATFFKLTWL